jgi:hypothetical protein
LSFEVIFDKRCEAFPIKSSKGSVAGSNAFRVVKIGRTTTTMYIGTALYNKRSYSPFHRQKSVVGAINCASPYCVTGKEFDRLGEILGWNNSHLENYPKMFYGSSVGGILVQVRG